MELKLCSQAHRPCWGVLRHWDAPRPNARAAAPAAEAVAAAVKPGAAIESAAPATGIEDLGSRSVPIPASLG